VSDLRVDDEVVDVWNQVDAASPRQRPKQQRREAPDDSKLMRVKASSPPQAVANSIRNVIIEQQQCPVIRAIGAGAVAQACKGIAIARGLVATSGRDLAANIGFDTVTGDDGGEISAQTFHLFLR
jgi:stage V sporulation protein S